ncbi:MAG: TIM barrel protein [Chloroflexi bacterium]|nr:TIM barrel protein [Chloroflexota bacterium]
MAQVSCSPITWGRVAFEVILDDIANLEYHGVEAHDPAIEAFRRQPGRLRSLLEERHLKLACTPFAGWFFDRSERKDEIERLRRLIDFVAEVDERAVIVFRSVPHRARRDTIAGEPPLLPLTHDRFGYLSDALNQYCDICADSGLRGAFQNRVGTYVETPDEYQEVINRTEPALVGLALDLGHWAYAGGDSAKLLRDNLRRIAYPRLMDLDRKVLDQIRDERLGFASFLFTAGFKELGEGDLDLAGALMPLENANYTGWVCVELARTGRTAKESAEISRAYLRERLHW